jgi:hypothetical protein
MKGHQRIKFILTAVAAVAGLAMACNLEVNPAISNAKVVKTHQQPECRQMCKGPDYLLPPLPLVKEAVSEEISYLFFTDHLDRLSGTFLRDTSRDILRLERVRKLYEEGALENWEDKYKAAFIFIHAGGPFARIDTRNFFIASRLFHEVSHESSDPLVAAESAEMAERALNKYVNASILLHRQEDEFPEDPYLPLVKIELNKS